MYFKVTSSLTASDTSYNEIEFKGCSAEVTGETSTCYFVKFYGGIAFMIGKDRFKKSTESLIDKPYLDESMIIADVTFWLGEARIKTFRTLLSPDDHEYTEVKKNALMWFKLTEETHYDRITHESINKVEFNTKTMAKKATTKAPETGLSVFEQNAKTVSLPEIPKSMTIGGVEFSEDLIKKEVAEVKKIKLKSETDEETYLLLKEKNQQFVKTRTAPENFRKTVVKPLSDWQKALKAQTDSYGELAREGQEHCEEQMLIFENWQAEQERIEQERVQKLVDERTQDLQSVAGILNRDSLHWTFSHNPSKLVENDFLETADDSEWNGLMKELEASLAAEKEKTAKQKEEFEAAKNAVFNTRIQMLQLVGGYDNPQQGVYTKNGHTLTDEQVRNTPEADWMPLMLSHNTVKEATNPFAATPVQHAPQQTEPTPNPSLNPFAQFAQAIESPVEEPTETTISEVEASEESFLPHTIWDRPSVEKPLGKTTLRIFPREHQAEAAKNIGEIAYDGAWDNGLMFIIYRNGAQ